MAKHTNSEMAIEYDGSLCLGGQVVTTSYGIAPDTASREERNANHAMGRPLECGPWHEHGRGRRAS